MPRFLIHIIPNSGIVINNRCGFIECIVHKFLLLVGIPY